MSRLTPRAWKGTAVKNENVESDIGADGAAGVAYPIDFLIVNYDNDWNSISRYKWGNEILA